MLQLRHSGGIVSKVDEKGASYRQHTQAIIIRHLIHRSIYRTQYKTLPDYVDTVSVRENRDVCKLQ